MPTAWGSDLIKHVRTLQSVLYQGKDSLIMLRIGSLLTVGLALFMADVVLAAPATNSLALILYSGNASNIQTPPEAPRGTDIPFNIPIQNPQHSQTTDITVHVMPWKPTIWIDDYEGFIIATEHMISAANAAEDQEWPDHTAYHSLKYIETADGVKRFVNCTWMFVNRPKQLPSGSRMGLTWPLVGNVAGAVKAKYQSLVQNPNRLPVFKFEIQDAVYGTIGNGWVNWALP